MDWIELRLDHDPNCQVPAMTQSLFQSSHSIKDVMYSFTYNQFRIPCSIDLRGLSGHELYLDDNNLLPKPNNKHTMARWENHITIWGIQPTIEANGRPPLPLKAAEVVA